MDGMGGMGGMGGLTEICLEIIDHKINSIPDREIKYKAIKGYL